MGQEPEDAAEPSAFTKAADWFQQLAAPLGQVRGLEDLGRLGPRPPLEALFEAVRAGMIGRRVETGPDDRRLAFTLSALDARFDSMGASAGQADGVAVAAREVVYAGLEFTEVGAAFRNVHTRIGVRPSLVCAPVELTMRLGPEQWPAVLLRYAPRVTAEAVGASRVSVSLRKHPQWGRLEAEVVAVSGRVTLRPIALGWRRWTWRIKRRIPAITLPLKLPVGAQVTGVSVDPDAVTFSVRIDEWRVEYSRLLRLARNQR